MPNYRPLIKNFEKYLIALKSETIINEDII